MSTAMEESTGERLNDFVQRMDEYSRRIDRHILLNSPAPENGSQSRRHHNHVYSRLRSYQREGVEWLMSLHNNGLSGILGTNPTINDLSTSS